MKNPIQQFLNRGVKAPTKENTYVPKNGICDAYRKEQFTNYNVDLMQRIRTVKLNRL